MIDPATALLALLIGAAAVSFAMAIWQYPRAVDAPPLGASLRRRIASAWRAASRFPAEPPCQ